MSNDDDFQIAFERATREIAEIDVCVTRLARRRELLEGVVEPLKRLVAEGGGPAIIPNSDADDLNRAGEGGTDLVEDADAFGDPNSFGDTGSSGNTGSFGGSFGDTGSFGQAEEETGDTGEAGVHEEENPKADSREDVALLAYRFWSERGGVHGHHEEDWLRAVEELQNSGL
jgi:hypothetical protein